MTSADLRHPVKARLAAEPARRSGQRSILWPAVAIACAVVALDQLLDTTPAALAASPSAQAAHWAGDVILAAPFAAVALWVGGWLGDKLGLTMTSRWDVFAQACLVTLVLAVLLVPAWFGHYAVDSLVRVPPAPAAAHAGHAGHEHGGAPPVAASWVGTAVLYLLMSVPVAAAAVCVGQRVARRLTAKLGETDVVVRIAVSVGAVALAFGLGWFLQGVASQEPNLVTYKSGFIVVHEHHHAHAHIATITDVVVQPPFAYQLATAAQDSLAGQAIGLPVTFAGLLWLTRRMRTGSQSAPTQGTNPKEGPRDG